MNSSSISRLVVGIACMAVWIMPLFAKERVTFLIAMAAALVLGVLFARRANLDPWLLDVSSYALVGAVVLFGLILFKPTVLSTLTSHGIAYSTITAFAWYGVLWLPPLSTLLSFVTRRQVVYQQPPPYYYDPRGRY